MSALTGEKVYSDLFSLTDESEMGHIELSRAADLVVVAPATADLMGKLAAGLANDLASTALLATDKRILMAPAMNVRMWQSPSVRRSAETLARDGVLFVGPNDGEMACGEFGPGRMAEPLEIVAAIEKALKVRGGALDGFKALVTAGPTQEPLDPVRFLANRSSGKQGYAIADALAGAGADTVLISGPGGDRAAVPCEAAESHHGARDAGGLRSRIARRHRGDERGRRRLAAGYRRQQQDQEGRATIRLPPSGWWKIPTSWPAWRGTKTARVWSSVLRPRPTRSCPMPSPSAPAKARTGSSPMMFPPMESVNR